jgi:hypothetical protein
MSSVHVRACPDPGATVIEIVGNLLKSGISMHLEKVGRYGILCVENVLGGEFSDELGRKRKERMISTWVIDAIC